MELTGTQRIQDKALDAILRPSTWQEYVGQKKVKRNLKIAITAARGRNEALEHILIYGPAGLGKTTLAHIIADEMQANIRITSGPAIERIGDLASLLTNLESGDILFIDEAHRLPKLVGEILYPAMETRTLDIILGKGAGARTLQLDLPPFTLIAATTRAGLLTSPLRSRFGATYRLDFYEEEEIEQVLARSALLMKIKAPAAALKRIARSSRATPRVANRLLKRARDLAQVEGTGEVTDAIAQKTLTMLEVDERGLEETDRRILRAIGERFHGGPAGLQAIAAACAEEEDTILDLYEPYLMQIGFLVRTPRGRVLAPLAYEHLGMTPPEQPTIFS